MATTLGAAFKPGNYCNAPTIDVEILDDTGYHCAHCAQKVIRQEHSYSWRHDDPAAVADDHTPEVLPRCHYCRAEGTLTANFHAWHTSMDCSRCGGSYGIALGD